MRLRAFHPNDLQTLYEIDQACFPPGISYTLDELQRFTSHRNSQTWVAQDGEETVGFVVVARETEQVGHIVTVDVLKPWRRRGVGWVLMEAAEDWATQKGLQLIYLETAEDNVIAQRFYAERDYMKVEKLEGYYTNGRAAWVMVKRLKAEVKTRKSNVQRRD